MKNISVCGDTRIDRVYQISHEEYENEFLREFYQSGNVIVCGSTWPPDEKIISQYINTHDNLKAVIVPHEIHEEHLSAIEKMLAKPCVRLSKCDGAKASELSYIIVDSMGMLSKMYRYGRLSYVGGGFGVGIHNTLEAVVYGIPVIFGPNYRKFKEAFDLIGCGTGFSVSSYDEFSDIVEKLLTGEANYSESCAQARAYVEKSVGVSDFIYNKINELQ